jgi:hypothetical protein
MANDVYDRKRWKFENGHPAIVKMVHGRRNEEQEYYQFKLHNKKYGYLAQRSGLHVIVYKVYPGVNGQVQRVGAYLDPAAAIKAAYDLAVRDAEQAVLPNPTVILG